MVFISNQAKIDLDDLVIGLEEHLKHGTYTYPYKRNQKTTWYIVYNIDLSGNIFVNKIISNYLTVS
jgi:hypothetical protein